MKPFCLRKMYPVNYPGFYKMQCIFVGRVFHTEEEELSCTWKRFN